MGSDSAKRYLSKEDKIKLAGLIGSLLGNCFTAEEVHHMLAQAIISHQTHHKCEFCR